MKEQSQDKTTTLSRAERFERWSETVSAILLGLVTIATAWSGYQAARWGGEQSTLYTDALGLMIDSTRAATEANQLTQVDIALFLNYANAYAAGNEELATFVGREGALSFLRSRSGLGSEAYNQALAVLEDWTVFREKVMELYDQLEKVYGLEADRETILAEKRRTVEEFNRRLRCEAPDLFQTEGFRSFKGVPANNAYIMSFVRYNQDLDLFYSLYEANGRDLRSTIEDLKQLNKAKGPPKQDLKRLIAE